MTLAVPASPLVKEKLGGNLGTLLDELTKGASRNKACAAAKIHPMKLSRFMKKAEDDPEYQQVALLVLAAEAEDENEMWERVRSIALQGNDKVALDAAKFYLERRHGYHPNSGSSKTANVQIVGKLEQVISAEVDDGRALPRG